MMTQRWLKVLALLVMICACASCAPAAPGADERVNALLEAAGRRAQGREMAEALRVFYARESIVITRKTKRGMGEMDIRPAIRELTVTPEADFVRIEAVISAQEPTLNPEHLVTALRQLDETIAPDFAAFRREEVYHEDGGVFR